MTYAILLPLMPALFMVSLIQTAGHKIAALMGVFSRLLKKDLSLTGLEIDRKTAVGIVKYIFLPFIPIDKARVASVQFPFKLAVFVFFAIERAFRK